MLAESSQRIGRGDFEVELPIYRRDEIGELADDFRGMARSLQLSADELHESETRYKLAFAGANDTLWDWNLATGKVFVGNNLADSRDLVEAKGIMSWRRALKFVHPKDRPGFLYALRAHLSGERAFFEHEHRLNLTGSRIVWLRTRGVVLRREGQVFRMAGSLTDVTERKAFETELIRTKEKAEFANRTKSEFLASMSHELRSPLNSMIGFAEVLKLQLFGDVGNDRYREYAEYIHESGIHLLALIDDLLDISRIEAGAMRFANDDVSIHEVLTRCFNMLRPKAEERGLHLELDIPDAIPRIRGDPLRLDQIVINLLSNSIKFTPRGGRVSVTVTIDDTGSFTWVIEDSGVGIPPDHLERVLRPFEQVRESYDIAHEGSGLGLYLTKSLVELHDGSMSIESTVGEFTRVTIRFPPGRTVEKPNRAVHSVSAGEGESAANRARRPAN